MVNQVAPQSVVHYIEDYVQKKYRSTCSIESFNIMGEVENGDFAGLLASVAADGVLYFVEVCCIDVTDPGNYGVIYWEFEGFRVDDHLGNTRVLLFSNLASPGIFPLWHPPHTIPYAFYTGFNFRNVVNGAKGSIFISGYKVSIDSER